MKKNKYANYFDNAGEITKASGTPGYGAALDIGRTAINGFLSNSTLNDSSGLKSRIDAVKNYKVAANDNDSLMNEWGNFRDIGWISRRDAGGKSFSDVGLNALQAGAAGGMAGASLGPMGAAAGAVIGIGSSLWGGLAGSFSARRRQRQLQREANLANKTAYSSFMTAADRIESNAEDSMEASYYGYGGFLKQLSNYFDGGGGIHIKKENEGKFTASADRAGMGVQEYASKILANKDNYSSTLVKRANFAHNAANWHDEGGNLYTTVPNYYTHGGTFSNGVQIIENGGTHEENSIGGVPVSIDPNGKPNLVEEGEAIFKDYVFSNRIKPSKAMISAFNLRDASFADNFKSAQKESSERPNDPISKNGLENAFNIMKNLQESVKQSKGKKNNQGVNKFSLGDQIVNWFKEAPNASSKTGDLDDILKTDPYRYAPIVGQGIQVFKDLLGDNKPDYSNVDAMQNSFTPIKVPRINNYLTYKPLDTNYYATKVGNQTAALRRSIANATSGNRAALIANQIAANNSATSKIGEMYRSAEESNLNQRQSVENFNRATNMANMDSSYKEQAANNEARMRLAMQAAQMREAIAQGSKSAKSQNYNSFLNQLGQLGQERTSRNTIKWMAEKGLFGNNPNASKVKAQQLAEQQYIQKLRDKAEDRSEWDPDYNPEYDENGNIIAKCGGKLKKSKTRKGLTF